MKGIPVDASGAKILKRRLEQQEHWQQADAVREGRQLPVDPDSDALEELGDGIRVYSVQHSAAEEVGRICKRLIDGRWQRVESPEPAAGRAHAAPGTHVS